MSAFKDVEELDLRVVTRHLAQAFEHHPPYGYLRGKTAMRNALEQSLGCSELVAEELVDTLESRGFVHFDGRIEQRAEADAVWQIKTHRSE